MTGISIVRHMPMNRTSFIEEGRMRNTLIATKFWLVKLGAIALFGALSACSGGAGTESNANTGATANGLSINYTGPAPTSTDVQAFKNEFWVNVVSSSRCGGCHNANGQAPTFARLDDVNLAYQAALQVVNLAQADQSRIVTKVGGGHNCWTSSASACADILTTWIRNWANASGNGGSGTQIQLVAPVDKDVGASKTFPTASTGFASTVYPLLTQYCSGCHTSAAATPQKPYFASADVNEAYSEARAKINLDTPALSRLVVRLGEESHNCWSNCSANATTMLNAITAFANGIPLTQIDSSLVVSKALTMYDGTIASGGSRYEANTIARYFFKEGTGSVANDTSGVEPATNLTLSGAVNWSGGWGISVAAGGKAQATTTSSRKLSDRRQGAGHDNQQPQVVRPYQGFR
jgi:mono/diheme cytochrome c family protein